MYLLITLNVNRGNHKNYVDSIIITNAYARVVAFSPFLHKEMSVSSQEYNSYFPFVI